MSRVSFLKSKSFQCFQNEGIACKGFFFIDDRYYHDETMLEFLALYKRIEDIINDLNKFNGSFLFYISIDNETLVATDSVRSIPCYYTVVDDKIVKLSDQVDKTKISKNDILDIQREEFKLTGYVSANKTLLKTVYQLEANQYLIIDQDNKFEINAYSYNFSKLFTKHKISKLEVELRRTFTNISNRLIKVLNGKTAVIPLSGGYDSRIVALLLHEKKYKNVLCFTYGRKTSPEVRYSKIIAERLNFKWVFVEYTDELISEYWSEFENYYSTNFDYVSAPHVQDFFAIQHLTINNVISEDSYVIPGHSGDLLGGSHLRKFFKELKGSNNLKQICEEIYKRHYYHSKDRHYEDVHLQNIYESLVNHQDKVNHEINLTDFWNINNRQAKYIINSVRAYEHFNLKWIIPLWDKELAEFFYKLDLKWKIKNNLYNQFLEKKFKKNNIDVNLKRETLKTKFANLLRRYLPLKIKIKLKKIGKKQVDVNNFDFIMEKLDFKPDSPIYHVNAAMINRLTEDKLTKD